MSNIRIDLEATVINGQALTFKSPVDCSQITGLIVYYPEGDTTKNTVFQFADAHGNNVGSINLFAENVLVKVILDTDLNRAYVQNADTNKYIEDTFLKKSGGTLSGAIDMGSNRITNVGTPENDTDAANKKFVADQIEEAAFGDIDLSNYLQKSGDTMSGEIAMGGNKITGLGTPTDDADAATKAYADSLYTGYHRQLTSADDLNTITDDGVYFYATGNAPANAYWNAASIVAVFGAPASSKKKIQIEIRYGVSGCMASRSLQSSGWQPWSRYATTDYADVGNLDLVWTNSKPNSRFDEQTVPTSGLSGYDYVLVCATFDVNNPHRTAASHIATVGGSYDGGYLCGRNPSSGAFVGRSFTVSTSGVTFTGGYTGTTADNKYCIPFAIFGIKK